MTKEELQELMHDYFTKTPSECIDQRNIADALFYIGDGLHEIAKVIEAQLKFQHDTQMIRIQEREVGADQSRESMHEEEGH